MEPLLAKAQASRIEFTNGLFSENLIKLVNAHADAIGVPFEFILWPLLTAAASFMGINAHVQINREWPEPAIIWFVIAARKGEKKTAALNRIRNPIIKIENILHQEWMEKESPLLLLN